MYANFTEETCTGTGVTLTLAGATSGNIPFSASFADGDLVAYVVEDSGGSIKVAGVGTWNTGGTITRDDTWNYNGTVVDKNPATNITLSGGTHTVRCDVIGEKLNSSGITGTRLAATFVIQDCQPDGITGSNTVNTTAFAGQLFFPYVLYTPRSITSMGFIVSTADVLNPNTRLGIYSTKNGLVGKLLIDTGAIDISSTGDIYTTLSDEIVLPAGVYVGSLLTESATAVFGGYARNSQTFGGFGRDRFSQRNNMFTLSGATGVLTDNPVPTSDSLNNVPLILTRDF